MAEERLIDDDKDRKYKIRINENGEEELVIAPQSEEDEAEAEEIDFEVPDFDTDDEEAAVMTPEQLAERQRQREEEAAKRAKKAAGYLSRAKTCLAEEDYSGAVYALAEACELDGENGEIYALQIKALSKNFTDWSRIDECAEAAERLAAYGSAEQKDALKKISAPLTEKIAETQKAVARLNEENESKKTERREAFLKRRKASLTAFCSTAAPFVVFLVLAIVIGVNFMYTREDALFTVITIVFAALSAISFIAMLVAAHKLWDASRNVKLNESNFSTKLGREYEENKTLFEQLTAIYAAINNVSAEENAQTADGGAAE